jgi:hypothetical protein
LIGSHDPGGGEYIVQKTSFKRAIRAAAVGMLCVLLLQVPAGAEEQGAAPVAAAPAQETTTTETTAQETTTTLAETTTTTEPPTTTTTEPGIGVNTLPPPSPPPGGPLSGPGPQDPVAIGSPPASSGPAGAFKSAMRTIGSTATTAAQRLVLPAMRKLARVPAVRKLTQSQPVAATKQAVMFVTEELSELSPSKVAPFLWLALLALLVTCGAFLRLWWAPIEWPSTRSLAVGAHRRAGQRPRRPGWQGWQGRPAAPPPRRRTPSGWKPPLPAATGLTPRRIGIDVARLRDLPPAGKPVFTGEDEDAE